MFNELVGYSQTSNVGVVSIVGHEFKHGTTKSTFNDTVFKRNDMLILAPHLMQDIFIDGFQEAHVVVSHTDTLRCNTLYSFSCKITNRTNAENSQVIAIPQFTSFTNGYFLKGAMPIHQFTSATRIAYSERSHIGKLSCIHQFAQFMLIIRCRNRQVGYRTQEGQVKSSMMSRTIFTYKTSTVDTQNNIESAYSHIVYDIIIGTLQER